MRYAKIKNDEVLEYPYPAQVRLRNEYPNVSFPSPLDEGTLNSFDVYVVHDTERPSINWYEEIREVQPIFDGTKWIQHWEIVQLNHDQQKQKIEIENIKFREKRNDLLAKCDWTQLPDSKVDKDAWAEYREKLRMLPQKYDIPFNAVWPTPPEEK